jgi:hypothetical protein
MYSPSSGTSSPGTSWTESIRGTKLDDAVTLKAEGRRRRLEVGDWGLLPGIRDYGPRIESIRGS